jgi:hypothetical protein
MNKMIILGGILATAGLFGFLGQNDAFACNRTAGCAMDSFLEDYEMKRNGQMDKAMQAGRENIEAFRALQAAQQKFSLQQKSSAKK